MREPELSSSAIVLLILTWGLLKLMIWDASHVEMDVSNYMHSNHCRFKLVLMYLVKNMRQNTQHMNATRILIKKKVLGTNTFCCFCGTTTTEWLDVLFTCKALPLIKQLWNNRLLVTFKQDFSHASVCRLCTGVCATVEKVKGHVDWLSAQEARQPGFPSSWLCKLKFKETFFFWKYPTLRGVC